MELRPEQEAVLDYARRNGSQAPVTAIRERLERTFTELDALAASVSEEVATRRPNGGGWAVHEVVDHLVESHRLGVGELRSLLAGRSPEDAPIPAGLLSEDPFVRPWPELRGDLKAIHAAFLAEVAAATDSTPTTARAPVVMVVKCAAADGSLEPVEWVQAFDWKTYAVLLRGHALEHRNQIRRILAGFEADAAR